jgi:OHCU decarboxylase
MTLAALNALDKAVANLALRRCCGSSRWARRMAEARPFASVEAVVADADAIWSASSPSDWLEAFAAHPEIGAGRAGESQPACAPVAAGASPGANTTAWSEQEQAGAKAADSQTRQRLADANRDYRARFGYIFIVCATGRTADEMLALLELRLRNDPVDELPVAAEEQRKITRLRLIKLLAEDPETP